MQKLLTEAENHYSTMKWTEDLHQETLVRITTRNFQGEWKWSVQKSLESESTIKDNEEVLLCCNECYNYVTLTQATIPDTEITSIEEYGRQAGLKDGKIYIDLSTTIYCSDNCGITGEL